MTWRRRRLGFLQNCGKPAWVVVHGLLHRLKGISHGRQELEEKPVESMARTYEEGPPGLRQKFTVLGFYYKSRMDSKYLMTNFMVRSVIEQWVHKNRDRRRTCLQGKANIIRTMSWQSSWSWALDREEDKGSMWTPFSHGSQAKTKSSTQPFTKLKQ